MHEHHLDVGGCEHRFTDLETLAYQKEHRHHHQGGVVMPASPPVNLIFAEATLLLGVFECALDEIALPLHVGNPLDWGVGSGVRQAVLQSVRLSRHDQVPLVRLVIAALVEPYPSV